MELKDLKGKKSYIIAIATVCYALGGAVAGYVSLDTAIPLILGALGLSGLRHSITDFLLQFQIPGTTNPSTPATPSY